MNTQQIDQVIIDAVVKSDLSLKILELFEKKTPEYGSAWKVKVGIREFYFIKYPTSEDVNTCLGLGKQDIYPNYHVEEIEMR